MNFIDTHTHIYGEEFREDWRDVVQRAEEAGAKYILLPNLNEASIGEIDRLCNAFPRLCKPMMGLHPEDMPDAPGALLDKMEELLQKRPDYYAAVGEVGMDLYWDSGRKEEQKEVFRRQIGWSVKYDLPMSLHIRAAHREAVDELLPFKENLPGGVFHCFGGAKEEAEELLTFDDFYLGIGGLVTFKKSTLPETLKAVVPLSRIVLETDAPYLTPVPFRGKRNEPAYIPYVAKRLAEIYEVSSEEVAEVTTANAEKLFSLK